MKGWLRMTATGVGIAVLSGMAWIAVDMAIHAGVFRHVYYTVNEGCQPVKAPLGVEDVAIDRTTGWVYLAAADRQWGQGAGLYALRLDAPEEGVFSLTGGTPDDLYPRGIGLWADEESGEKRLFSVTPAREGRTARVHIFGLKDIGSEATRPRPILTLIKTIEDPLFQDPQDVAATGLESFYITTGPTHREGSMLRRLEILLRWKTGSVVHVDADAAKRVAEGLTFANGVVFDPDEDRLYVTETTEGKLRIFGRAEMDGKLTEEASIFIGPGPDNLDLDGEGRLWVASHPKLLAFGVHVGAGEGASPSLVQRIKNDTFEEANWPTRTVYADRGRQLSGSSAAAFHNGRLVIGSFFEPYLLICEGVE